MFRALDTEWAPTSGSSWMRAVGLHLQKAWVVDILESWAKRGGRIVIRGPDSQEMVAVVPSVDGSLGSQSQVWSPCSSSLVSREAFVVCLQVENYKNPVTDCKGLQLGSRWRIDGRAA